MNMQIILKKSPLTFTLHVFDQVRVKPGALQLFVQIERPFPFDLIIWDSIILVAAPRTCTLRRKEGFCQHLH